VKGYVKYGLVCFCLMGSVSLRAATGLIGSVSSLLDGSPEAIVELTNETDTSQRFAVGIDSEGIFRFPNIPPGKYSVKVSASGVRAVTLREVTILPGVLKDVGEIHLKAPCEELPNMVCVGGHFMLKREESGKIEMIELCTVDFRDQPPECIVDLGVRGPVLSQPDHNDGRFAFHTASDGVYLIPVGVSFSLNPSTKTDRRGCTHATYVDERIRIDSLPPGSRACVLTGFGEYVELVFSETIKPGQGQGQGQVTVEYSLLGNDLRPLF
jgi:hypothetical protein